MKTIWEIIKNNKFISLLIIVGFLLRFWGTYHGYHLYHPDEPQIYARALLSLQGQEEKLGYWGYPALIPLVHKIFYAIVFLPANFIIQSVIHFDLLFSRNLTLGVFMERYVFGLRDVNVLYWGRYTSAILGTVSILFTYITGKKYFDKRVGLLAALFLTLNYRHVLSSHFSLVDVPNDLFFLIALLAILNVYKKAKTRDYILAAIACALSFSVKLSPFIVIPFALAHYFHFGFKINRRILIKLFAVILFFVSTVILINLFHISHLEDAVRDFESLSKRYAAGKIQLMQYPYIYLYIFGLTPPFVILAFVGFWQGLKKHFKESAIILSLILAFFFSLTIYSGGGLYVRNFVGIFPLIFIFSALGLISLYDFFIKKYDLFAKVAFLIIILVSLVSPINNILLLDTSYSKEWNFVTAKKYFSQNFEMGSVAAPLSVMNIVLPKEIKSISYRPESFYSLSELQELGVNYVVLDSDSLASILIWWMSNKNFRFFSEKPNELAYQSFEGGALKELFSHKVAEFSKPWQAPDSNIFLFKIPQKDNGFKGKTIYSENFDTPANWKVKVMSKLRTMKLKQIFGDVCQGKGCISIENIYKTDKFRLRFIRYTSEPIEIEPGYRYRVTAQVQSTRTIPIEERDGFIKAELYAKKREAQSDRPGENIFISSRDYGPAYTWHKVELDFLVPCKMRYLTISFQADGASGSDFYYDNLTIEKSNNQVIDDKCVSQDKNNQVPEDLLFINSIL